MAEIRNFHQLRVGGKWPACFDIWPLGYSDYGLFAQVNTYRLPRIELRKKEHTVALFVFGYDDLEIPEWWRDAEVLWSQTYKEEKEGKDNDKVS